MRDLGGLGWSFAGFLNKSKNMGLYFLNMLLETAKFLSKRSTLRQNPSSKWDIASHDFIFLMNSVNLKKKTNFICIIVNLHHFLHDIGISKFVICFVSNINAFIKLPIYITKSSYISYFLISPLYPSVVLSLTSVS